MKGIVLAGLAAVAAFAIWKHHVASQAASVTPQTDIPSGVSVYSETPAPSSQQQLLAAQPTNSDAVSELGYSAAFGPNENLPGSGESEY